MRFASLRVDKYGCFRELELALPAPAEGAGLHVLLGPNEAGKTTLLFALRALLYGFPERTPYSFAYEGTQFRVAAEVEFAGGERVALERRKGRGETLSGMPEAQLAARLGVPASIYASLCAFSLSDLVEGRDLLKGGDAREVILGAGLGHGASVSDVRAALLGEAESLYKPRGQLQPINSLASAIERAASEERAAQLKPEDYEAKLEELTQARAVERAAARDAESAGDDSRRLRRLAEALPLERMRRELVRRADECEEGVPASFPRERAEEPARLTAERDAVAVEVERAAERLREREALLEGMTVDEALLARREEILRLVSQTGTIADYERDIPKLEGQLAALRGRIASGLAEARPGWGLEQLEAFAVEPSRRARIRELLATGASLREDRVRLEQSSHDRGRAEREQRAALEGLGEPDDVGALRGLVAEWPDRQAEAKQLAEAEARLARARDGEARAWSELDPPAPPELMDAAGPPLPGEETARSFEERLRKLDAQTETLAARADEAAELVARIEGELATAFPTELPSREQLAEARGRRDGLWREMREGTLFGGELAGEYEEAVAEADRIADALLAHAETVARRDQRERELVLARETLAERRGRLEELAEERRQVEAEWSALFAALGVAPHGPAAMREWLRSLRRLRGERAERLGEEARAAEARQALRGFSERLCAAAGAAGATAIAPVASAALERVRASDERERNRISLLAALAETERARRDEQGERERLGLREEEHAAGWRALLDELGLEQVPAGEAAREAIEALWELRKEWRGQAPDWIRRISEMRAGLQAFTDANRALCEEIAPELIGRPPREATDGLRRRLEAATEARARAEQALTARDEARGDVAERRERLTTVVSLLAGLLRASAAASEEDLLALCERVREAAALRAEASVHEHKLAGIAVQTDPDAFRTQLAEALAAGMDADGAAAQAEGRATEHRAAAERRDAARQAIGRLEAEAEAFDGESRALAIAERTAEARATLAAHTEHYAVLTLARTILERELERFRRENQPQVLRRADELFLRMTGGRYRGLRLEEGETGAIRAIRAGASDLDAGLGWSELSTGTREQLYLALRLAWIDLRAEASEPLPLVLDDVLVNFDEARTRATLGALAEVARRSQVLFLTCHPRLTELALEAVPSAQVVRLPDP